MNSIQKIDKHRFDLSEVVSIIAPGSNKKREHTREVVCSSVEIELLHRRQWAAAWLHCVGLYDTRLPLLVIDVLEKLRGSALPPSHRRRLFTY